MFIRPYFQNYIFLIRGDNCIEHFNFCFTYPVQDTTGHQSTQYSTQEYPVQPASQNQVNVQPGQIITLPNGQQLFCVAAVSQQQTAISNPAAQF